MINFAPLKRRHYIFSGTAVVLILVVMWLLWCALTPYAAQPKSCLQIHRGATASAVFNEAKQIARPGHYFTLRILCMIGGYNDESVRPGNYPCDDISTLRLFRNIRGGLQTPVRLTVPPVRTVADLAGKLAEVIEPDSATLMATLTDSSALKRFCVTPETVISLFLPNTYEVYWTITPTELLERMQKESDAFWIETRRIQAHNQGLTPTEVVTLASIIEQETANDGERPMVAGMYLNRLHTGMPLQADPTVKFALQDFSIKRITHEHLKVESPYNTYKVSGLPPGPICIPSLASIKAVLQPAAHQYMYMCAKEDFSGTHNFAVTYQQHLQNAHRYSDALNARNIH